MRRAAIEVQSIRGGNRKRLLRGGTFGRYLTSGHLAYVNQGTLYAVPFDLATLAVHGAPVPVLRRLFSRGLVLTLGLAAYCTSVEAATQPPESSLLFYLPADNSLTADVAKGDPVPNFSDRAKVVANGRIGGALETQDDNVLSWKAAGNISGARVATML